jgi:hypothetical protein
MENNTIKKAIWYQSFNEILIAEDYPDGSVEGELVITCTPMGYQLRIYDDSWKILNKCKDLFKLLSEVSTEYLPIEVLAHKIFNIGYELEIIY